MTEPRRAPELPADAPWLGAGDRPPQFEGALRGRVALLCFWTTSSIHSQIALDTLALLQLRFAGRPVTVVGVHTARRPAERGRESVAAATLRARVRHPVLIDDDAKVFDAYRCSAWPTFVLVDGTGEIRYQGAGEPDLQRLGAAIEALADECTAAPAQPWPAAWPPLAATSRTELRWPAGLAVDPERGLLWIADGGRDRVLGVALDGGEIRHEIGCGVRGFADGDGDLAAFADPRGLCVVPGGVIVADFHNHALRRIDVATSGVSTVCGNGAPYPERGLGGPIAAAVLDGDDAIVSAASFHQLRTVSVTDGRAMPFAGTGAPGTTDGLPLDATLAEPRALAVNGARIAFVDGGGDALRVLDRDAQRITTWATREHLASPCGVAWWNDEILVCDTLGDRILRFAGAGAEPVVLAGASAGLARPEAIAVHGERAFVADTGNHRIVVVPLTGGAPTGLVLCDERDDLDEPESPRAELRTGGLVSLSAFLPRPDGARVDAAYPPFGLAGSLDGDVAAPTARTVDLEGEWGVLREVPTGPPGTGVLRFVVRYATRSHHAHARHVLERDVVRGVRLTADGPDAVEL